MHRGRRIRQQLQPAVHTRPMPLCLAGEFPELGPLFCPSLPPTLTHSPQSICTSLLAAEITLINQQFATV